MGWPAPEDSRPAAEEQVADRLIEEAAALCANMSETSRPSIITVGRGKRSHIDQHRQDEQIFRWYNHDHHHSGIALLTPEMLHYGMAGEVIELRQQVLDQAYARNPERFVRAPPKHPPQPTAVWINPPTPSPATEEIRH